MERNKLKAESLKLKASVRLLHWMGNFGYFVLVSFILVVFSFQLSCSGGDPKFQQYYNQGEALYGAHCSNCHQQNGTGLGRVYPPLNKSDFLNNNFERALCAIRFGMEGSIIVNGKEYNQKMPAIPTLTDLEIAQIATYIYNSWGNQKGIIEVTKASEVLKACHNP